MILFRLPCILPLMHYLVEYTIPALENLRKVFQEKSSAYMKVVKIGRTHMMDATPVTLRPGTISLRFAIGSWRCGD